MTREEQKHLKDSKIALEKEIKTASKNYGYKTINGFIYKTLSDFVYTVIVSVPPVDKGKLISANISFKPLDLDEVYWDVFEIKDVSKTQPFSFHVQGAFVAPSVLIKKFNKEVSDISEIGNVFADILLTASDIIEESLVVVNSVEGFADYIKTVPYQELNIILCNIHLGLYKEALDMAEEEIKKGNHGGFGTAQKSIMEYARDYCIKNGSITSKN